MVANNRRYFDSFDAFRFISFLLVYLSHIPVTGISVFEYVNKAGGIGVSFFFVLSGFLITYILLHEKLTYGNIELRKFFIRRVLRIWPLYYLMVLFAYSTPFILNLLNLPFSSEGYSPDWLMTCLFLENYKMMFTNDFPNVSPLRVMWSICVEEHFYLTWMLLISNIKVDSLPRVLFFAILIAIITRGIYSFLGLETIDLISNIDLFALGALPAYVLLKRKDIIVKISYLPSWVKYFVPLLALFYLVYTSKVQGILKVIFDPLLFGVMFAIIILFTLPGRNRLYIDNRNLMSILGRYTYGLYLFHTICINLMIQVFNKLEWEKSSLISELLILFLPLILSLIVSIASYHFFEDRFLTLKRYFTLSNIRPSLKTRDF